MHSCRNICEYFVNKEYTTTSVVGTHTKLKIFTQTPHMKSTKLKQFLLLVILNFLSEKARWIRKMSCRFSTGRDFLFVDSAYLEVIDSYGASFLCKVCFRSKEHRYEHPLCNSYNEYCFFVLAKEETVCILWAFCLFSDR